MGEKDPRLTAKDYGNLAPGDVVAGLEAFEIVEIQRVAPLRRKDAGGRRWAAVPPGAEAFPSR